MKVKMKLRILNSTRTKVTGMIVSRMEQGSITTMNSSYPLKLFFKVDTDQGWKDNPFQWTIYTIYVNRLIKGSTADHRRSKCTNHSGASCFTWLRLTIQPHSLMKTSQNAACSRNIALLITRDIVRQDSLNG